MNCHKAAQMPLTIANHTPAIPLGGELIKEALNHGIPLLPLYAMQDPTSALARPGHNERLGGAEGDEEALATATSGLGIET